MDYNLLNELNESQRAAVEYCDGAQLVIAGAGSGKTRVLTYKIAYLIGEKGLKPWNILALTFTNKAAKEMKQRIETIVGPQARYINMGTFQSIFSHILRAEANHIGFNSNFTIYDQTDSRSLVKTIIKEMNLDEKVYKPSAVADRISMAKNHLMTAAKYANSNTAVTTDMQHKMPAIKDIYSRYSDRCRQANAMDFDDLLLNIYLLFANNDEVRRKYAEKFEYVLVDEYQDTNFAQQSIVHQITKERQMVCVVGDDAQSIYSFRGANIDNILGFQQTYSNARLFKLERNYRSTQAIVNAANSLIKHNQRQIPKNVFSENEQGEKIKLKMAYSDKEEAMIVCNEISRLRRNETCPYSDFAILYRTNSQSRSFEEYMRKQNIPYRIYGGLSFYQRKEIKDIIAYYRVVANPDDEEAIKRIINYPARGIGNTTLSKVVEKATEKGISIWKVLNNSEACGLDISKATHTKLRNFCSMLQMWMQRSFNDDAYTLGRDIIQESGMSKDIFSGKDPEDIARQENVEEFLSGLSDFVEGRREEDMGDHVTLTDFLQEVSLMTDLDSDGDSDEPKVVLMTIHAAKGLEFKTVFVVGLEENIFPSPMCADSIRGLEEERRLLYVAITRAEKHCFLTCAQNRFRYGRMEFDTPSRFIRDIDSRFIHIDGERQSPSFQSPRSPRPSFKSAPSPKPSFQSAPSPQPQFSTVSLSSPSSSPQSSPSSSPLIPGDVIEHSRFGIGEVIKIEGTGDNCKATISFRNSGTKQLLLKFAKYNKL